jgi:hypothetical protein
LSSRAISATCLVGSTKMMPIFDTAASNDPLASPVSAASPFTHVTTCPALSAFSAPISISSGVMSTPVTRAPDDAAASAALPVPQARSTTSSNRPRRFAAATTCSAMGAIRSPTAS